MSDGNDVVDATNLLTTRDAKFFGGEGDDSFEIESVTARKLVVWTGDGNDTAEIASSRSRRTTSLAMGEGDDVFDAIMT